MNDDIHHRANQVYGRLSFHVLEGMLKDNFFHKPLVSGGKTSRLIISAMGQRYHRKRKLLLEKTDYTWTFDFQINKLKDKWVLR